MLWEKGDIFLMGLHMARLEKSADHFSFSFKKNDLLLSLKRIASSFTPDIKYKVRLLLSETGPADVSASALPHSGKQKAKTTFSGKKTDRNDVFLYHKTTNRALYDEESDKYRQEGYFDVLFTNTDGEVTEGALTNIMVKKGDIYLTPPICCGVLPGTYREYLLKTQEIPLKEKVLMKEDLDDADGIFLMNSVRGMVRVELSARS